MCTFVRSHIVQEKYKHFKRQITKLSSKAENAIYICLLLLRIDEYGPDEKESMCSFSLCLSLATGIFSSLMGMQSGWLVLVYSCLFSSKMITKSSCCHARLRTESSCPSGICYLQLPFLFHRYFRSWKKDRFSYHQFNLKVKNIKQTRSESNF